MSPMYWPVFNGGIAGSSRAYLDLDVFKVDDNQFVYRPGGSASLATQIWINFSDLWD